MYPEGYDKPAPQALLFPEVEGGMYMETPPEAHPRAAQCARLYGGEPHSMHGTWRVKPHSMHGTWSISRAHNTFEVDWLARNKA